MFYFYGELADIFLFFCLKGPDGIRDHDTAVLDPNTYVGIGTMSPEGSSDLNYLWRPSKVRLQPSFNGLGEKFSKKIIVIIICCFRKYSVPHRREPLWCKFHRVPWEGQKAPCGRLGKYLTA